MDYAQFHDLVETTIRGMYDRIPAKYHKGLEELLEVGELRLAVDQLIGGLARFNTPVTPAERNSLARMLARLKEPESRLDDLNVVEASRS
ncbi:MAG: hypothetical protein ACRDTM_05365 [Micromonosporaceae bacterium]